MSKNIKIGVLICSLLLLGVVGFVWYSEIHKDDKLIKEKDNNLSQSNKDVYQERINQAERLIAEAKSDGEKYNGYMSKGFNLYGLGKLLEAREAFKQAQKINPKDTTSYIALYQVLVDMTDYNGAKANIKRAINIMPGSSDLWRKYIILEQEKFPASNHEINNLYLEALSKTNNNIDVITVYAQFLEKTGNLQGSIEYWKKAMELNSNSKAVYQAEIDRINQLIQ